MTEYITTYLDSHTQELESKLHKLSFDIIDDVNNHKQIQTIKQYYETELINQLTDTSDNILYYCKLSLDHWFEKALHTIMELHKKIPTIINNLEQLKQLQLPEQRSEEWYSIRDNLLTASSLADALGKGHFQTRDDLLVSKTETTKQEFSKASQGIMEWGVKYEPVATMFYEHLYNVSIVEFGLIPHPQLSVFGASPDGICDTGSANKYGGRMLEIKCPPKRNFTKEVPKHYWMQMQGQLEVCDLEECDFLQVKLEEYSSVKSYEEDLYNDGRIKHGYTRDKLPKGLVLEYNHGDSFTYEYSPWLASLDEIINWKQDKMKANCVERWWKITRYECTLVRRDKEWWISVVPDIIKFWEDVVHYRKVGNEEVKQKIQGRKRGPRKKVFTISPPLKGYLLDSDDES